MCSLNENDVKNVLSNFLENESSKIINYSVSQKSDTSLGYLGKHLTLHIQYLFIGKKEERKFFIKTHGGSNRENDFLEVTGIFQREIDFYKILVGECKKYLKNTIWCPKYCFSKNKILILEDLQEKDFVMFNGDINLDEAHVEKALQAFSRLHASSLLLERKKSIELDTNYPFLFREVLYDENKTDSPTARWISWQIQDLLVGIDLLKKYSQKEKKIIKEKFNEQIMRIYTLNKKSTKYRNVISHGDPWKNNLMFHYSGKIPDFCVLVDFQFFRYAPPAHDVMQFLYFTTKKTIRDNNKEKFLNFYYENLMIEFQNENENIENLLPKRQFFESCEFYKELAVIQSLLSMHYLLGPVTLNVDDGNYEIYENYLKNHRHEYMKMFFENESYTDKIIEIFCELIDDYILKK